MQRRGPDVQLLSGGGWWRRSRRLAPLTALVLALVALAPLVALAQACGVGCKLVVGQAGASSGWLKVLVACAALASAGLLAVAHVAVCAMFRELGKQLWPHEVGVRSLRDGQCSISKFDLSWRSVSLWGRLIQPPLDVSVPPLAKGSFGFGLGLPGAACDWRRAGVGAL